MAGLVMFEIVTKVGTFCPDAPDTESAFIKDVLKDLGYPTYAFIIHNEDVTKDGKKKDPHFHIIARRHSTNGRYLNVIAEAFGIAPNFVEKIKGGWSDAVLYLTHKNAPEKFQYSDAAVDASFDYSAEVNASKLKVEKRTNFKSLERRAFEFVDSVIKGEKNWIDMPESFTVEEYHKIKKILKDAEYYDRVKRSRANVKNDFKILYIHGIPGSGKDVFARWFGETEFNNQSIYSAAAGRYPFDGYSGQPVVIVSDLDTTKLRGRDFLRTFDPHGMGDVDGRMFNRNLSNCKVVIFTHELNFFSFVDAVCDGMDKRQFYRRFSTIWNIEGDEFDIFEHKSNIYDFDFVRRCLLPDEVKKVRDSGSKYDPEASAFNLLKFVSVDNWSPCDVPYSTDYLPEDDFDLFDDNPERCPF